MSTDRREFLARGTHLLLLTGAAQLAWDAVARGEPQAAPNYETADHWWAMAIDVEKCIGCGNCVRACKEENDVPREPYYFRTWVERYHVPDFHIENPIVDSPDGGKEGFPPSEFTGGKNFFVPKFCNHCIDSPCTQVCPVGATFCTPDGVVLVDQNYCVGCRYCIQACPYGCRFFHPNKHVADKCTLCYHRITRGLKPACVEVCPTQSRVFGDLKNPDPDDPIKKFYENNRVQALKPHLGTEPQVYYAGLDKEVR